MDRKTLLVDMDAIIADLASEWYRRYNVKYNKNLRVEDVKEWDVKKTTNDARVYGVLKDPGLYLNLRPFQAGLDALEKLSGKFDVFLLTAAISAPQILADKAIWVQKYMPWFSAKNFFTGYHKELVRGDFFIDDAPKNLAKWGAMNPQGKTITIDYPYNQGNFVDFRAHDWRHMDNAWRQIFDYLMLHV